ncbi:MAG: hypothetical protein ACYTEX_26370 [Planctomycetota bacterium]|jgi:hypothetical protein
MIPPLGKRTPFFVLVWLSVFLAFPGLYCEADECGFTPCPNSSPPCYKVTFSGVMNSNPNGTGPCVPYSSLNGTWMLKKSATEDCTWETDGEPWVLLLVGEDLVMVYREDIFCCTGPHGSGSCGNCSDCKSFPFDKCVSDADDCRDGPCFDTNYYAWGCDGVASYEPEWNCNQCGNCGTVPISSYKEEPAYVPNKDCCPVPPDVNYIVRIEYDDANEPNVYVVPECNIQEYDSSSGDWNDVSTSNVVTVTSNPPSDCADSRVVTFTITTFAASPPLSTDTRVKCTASFTNSKDDTGSLTETVEVQMGCTPCCSGGCGGGGVCGGGGGGACSSGISLP